MPSHKTSSSTRIVAALLAGHVLCWGGDVAAEETPSEGLRVSNDFPGGSGDVVSLDPDSQEVHLQPTLHKDRGWPCWWYVRLDGLRTGEPVRVKLSAQPGEFVDGRVLPAYWSQPDRAAISTDDAHWSQTSPCKRMEGTVLYEFEALAERVWIAWGPPFLPKHADEVLDEIAANVPNAVRFVLAETRQGRPVPGIRFGGEEGEAAKFGVWVHTRQHAWESGSSWVGRGFAEWAAGDDPAAIQLRKTTIIHYVPIMDVDNVMLGAGGKEAVPRDHNRDWAEMPHYPEIAAAQKRLVEMDRAGELDVYLDLHNPGPSSKRPFFYGPMNLEQLPKQQQRNHARWHAFAEATIAGPLPLEPKYLFATYVKTDEERGRMSSNWVRDHTSPHVLSTTLETAWNTQHSTAEGYRTVGRQLAEAVARYLAWNPRKE